MVNYTKMKHDSVRPFDVHDIISDVANDLKGYSFTLDAICDWGAVIEPSQLQPIASGLYFASQALMETNKTVDTFTYEGKRLHHDE